MQGVAQGEKKMTIIERRLLYISITIILF